MDLVNTGDTAWVLASGALVLFMTPALAIFYGGMVRAKSALNMMMMSFTAMGITTIIWVLYGYSLAFGTSQNGLIGGLDHLGLSGTLDQVVGAEGHQIPTLAFAMFQHHLRHHHGGTSLWRNCRSRQVWFMGNLCWRVDHTRLSSNLLTGHLLLKEATVDGLSIS